METVAKYTGATPGADSNDYVLFSTTVAFPNQRNALALGGIRRLLLSILASASGTLKWQVSTNGGTSWTQLDTQAVTGGSAEQKFDWGGISGYPDWRLLWTNGGSAQATWILSLLLVDDRASLT